MPASKPVNPSAERILRAAAALFARHGFAGTTTRMIAARARMNEALIFRHFPSKRRLYSAILERKMKEDPVLHGLDTTQEGSLEELLQTLATRIFRTIRDDPHFLRLLYFSGLEGHSLAPQFFKGYARRVSTFLAAALQRACECGEIRSVDASLAARAFVGMIAHHAQVEELFQFNKGIWSEKELVVGYVDLFLNGLRPRRERSKKAR